ncbi:MAG: DUF2461 domain-containing protein [Gemmatimonadetes bacterium]|nr:DUF2461 domain-containing protein [Gemmatimonadota bacterium]MDA1102397.1 DUF2461 domain-containing protein [Gemmatimonadota bacterium]
MAGTPFFTKSTFRFLEDLKANNDRSWFAANKSRYEDDLKTPALRLIEDFGKELNSLSPHFMATPRSLFRIHRDTRFSKDKTPYKTSAGIHFRHEQSEDAHAPGFYLHIAPGEVFVALGIWHPDAQALRHIREHIAEDPTSWKRTSRAKKFTEAFALEGESLKRPPKGFDPEHPMIDDLKRKDFIGVKRVSEKFATSPSLPADLAKTYRAGLPFMRFLCDSLSVPF